MYLDVKSEGVRGGGGSAGAMRACQQGSSAGALSRWAALHHIELGGGETLQGQLLQVVQHRNEVARGGGGHRQGVLLGSKAMQLCTGPAGVERAGPCMDVVHMRVSQRPPASAECSRLLRQSGCLLFLCDPPPTPPPLHPPPTPSHPPHPGRRRLYLSADGRK
jgi:hypothetical protein